MRLLFSFLMLVSFLHASITLNDGIDKIDDFQMLYYNDMSGSLDINDISKLDFNQTISNKMSLGYLKGKVWLKFIIINNTNKENFLLNFNEVWFDSLNLYSVKNQKITKSENGLKIILVDKEIKDTAPTFNLHINTGETVTYYVELKNSLSTNGKFTLYLNENSYLTDKIITIGLYMFYLGGAFIVVLLNLFLFFTLKEYIYVYYAMYVLTVSIYMMNLAGMIEYIAPLSYHKLHFLSVLSIFFLILFSKKILNTSKYTPTIDKLLTFFATIMLILVLLVILDSGTWFELYNAILPLLLIFILFASIHTWKLGNKEAGFYIVFMLIYLISLFIFAAMVMAQVEYNNFTRYTFMYASFFEISFFALVLANRFHKTRVEKQLVEVSLKDTKELSNRDALTNLYNRRYLDTNSPHYFNEARHKGEELCVIMLDIDKFKLVNDTYGHGVGDIVLSSVANIFSSLTRENDIGVRYGGEEFVMILSNTNLKNAQIIAEKIRIGIEKTAMNYEKDKELFVTMSLGISMLKDEDTSIGSIISRADEALYTSKAAGRNKVSTIK